MKKTLIAVAAAAAIATGFAGAAQAAGPVDTGVVNVGYRHFGFRHNYLWKYDYRPRYVCKRHYRWTLTRFGWRNVYVGYWCEHTNNY
jgi:hypothetical protein